MFKKKLLSKIVVSTSLIGLTSYERAEGFQGKKIEAQKESENKKKNRLLHIKEKYIKTFSVSNEISYYSKDFTQCGYGPTPYEELTFIVDQKGNAVSKVNGAEYYKINGTFYERLAAHSFNPNKNEITMLYDKLIPNEVSFDSDYFARNMGNIKNSTQDTLSNILDFDDENMAYSYENDADVFVAHNPEFTHDSEVSLLNQLHSPDKIEVVEKDNHLNIKLYKDDYFSEYHYSMGIKSLVEKPYLYQKGEIFPFNKELQNYNLA